MSTMKRLAFNGFLAGLWLCLAAGAGACGGGDDSGSGAGGGSGTGGDDTPAPPIAESCELRCDKTTALECSGGITADQCKAQCPSLEQALGETCKEEYARVYACDAGRDYSCVNGVLTPGSAEACVEVSYDLSLCVQRAPCEAYCKAAAATACGSKDEEGCVATCLAETSYSSTQCSYELSALRTCQGEGALDCKDGGLVTAGCEGQVQNHADCISSSENEKCEGYCAAAVTVGCAKGGIDACLIACQDEKHGADGSFCESYYDDLLECRVTNGIDCPGGTVSDVGCEAQVTAYQGCVMP